MKSVLFYLSILGFYLPIFSQTPPIAIDNEDIHIFPSDNSQHEVHISINKTNPLNLIVSANTFTNTFSQGHYFTLDGGITWSGGDNLPSDGESFGDPSTSFDASGRAYIVGMIGNGSAPDGYAVQHSDDRGLSWSEQVRGSGPTGVFDKEMIVTVDEMQSSPFANNFYCAWTGFNQGGKVIINRSIDGAESFEDEIILSEDFGQGTNVQIGPNGEVYVCWANYTDGLLLGQDIGFAFSVDGGINYSTSIPFSYNGIRTSNGGNSKFGNTRINDFPTMAVDKSCGDFRGRIYIAYPEFISEKSVIKVRFSDSHGVDWSDALTISIPDGKQSWFPWIAVDDLTGLVNIIYYAFDQDNSSTETNTFLAFSTDGGQNWDNIKVSDVSHETAPIDNNIFAQGYAGDYIGVASFNGKSYAAWADDRTGEWQIYISKVDYDVQNLISSQSNLAINFPTLISNDIIYQASNIIELANLQNIEFGSTSNIEILAGKEIIFNPGLIVSSGANVLAKIKNVIPCSTPGSSSIIEQDADLSKQKNIIINENNSIVTFAYPNPAIDYITLGCINNNEFNKAVISISNSEGKLIYSKKASLISKDQIRSIIDISNYPPGIYNFKINLGQTFSSSQFIKK